MKKSSKKKQAKVGLVSKKLLSKIAIMNLFIADQPRGCCIIETGDSAPRRFSTTAKGCKILGRQFGVDPEFIPGSTC